MFSGDEADAEDPQCVVEYVQDVYVQLRADEEVGQASPEYMDNQPEVTARMREILVDWMVQVHQKYKQKRETLFLSVILVDQFLIRRPVARKKLQLVGVTAVLIASKYEEIYPTETSQLVYICDNTYTKDEILKMEIEILTAVNFDLRRPTVVTFLDRFRKLNNCNDLHGHLTQYIVELALIDLKMIRYTPSHVAAAAVLLSNKLLKKQPSWPASMETHAGYSESSIKSCAKELCAILEAAPNHQLQAVRKKFSHKDYQSVAKMAF